MEERVSLPRSDLERESDREEEATNAIQNVLDQVSDWVHMADQAIDDLTEDEDILGPAILRGCQDLADGVGMLAQQLNGQTDEERRLLAQACLTDAQLVLDEQQAAVTGAGTRSNDETKQQQLQTAEKIGQMDENQLVQALHVAGNLLLDVEASLRAIDRSEADELADVALIVAKLFVGSVQSVIDGISPEEIVVSSRGGLRDRSSNVQIEILDVDDDKDDELQEANDSGTDTNRSRSRDIPAKNSSRQRKSLRRNERLKVLWPPLGPAVSQALDWGKTQAQEKPLLAVALGITLWPMAVLSAFCGTPLVVADHVVQSTYKNFEDAPLVVGLERTAAQVWQTGRLGLVCSKLATRQALRVAQRQLDRHGGPEQIARSLVGYGVDRVTHPVDTLGQCWNGLAWAVQGAVDLIAAQQNKDEEQSATMQALQQ